MIIKPLTAGRIARRLLAFYGNDPNKWTRGWYAFNKDLNIAVHGYDVRAKSFCVLGALEKIIPFAAGENWDRFCEAARVLGAAVPGERLPEFNDRCKDFNEFKAKLHEIARQP